MEKPKSRSGLNLKTWAGRLVDCSQQELPVLRAELIEALSNLEDPKQVWVTITTLLIKIARLRGLDPEDASFVFTRANLSFEVEERTKEKKQEQEALAEKQRKVRKAALIALGILVVGGGITGKALQLRDLSVGPVDLMDGGITRVKMVGASGLIGTVVVMYEERHCDSSGIRTRETHAATMDGRRFTVQLTDKFQAEGAEEWESRDEAWRHFSLDLTALRLKDIAEAKRAEGEFPFFTSAESVIKERELTLVTPPLADDFDQLASTWTSDLPESACK